MNDAATRPVEKLRAGPPPGGPSLRALLREGTATRHQRLDVSFAGMTDADDARQYHRFIRMNHACHACLEPLVATLADRLGEPTLAERQPLLNALASDMQSMGLAPVDAGRLGVDATDLPAAAGLVYVLDGSRLGARFIHREFIQKDLARRWPGISAAYLAAASGADAFGDRMAGLSDRVESQRARDRAIATAQAAFALFEAAYKETAHHADPEPVTS